MKTENDDGLAAAYCACGAQWHGHVVERAAPIIDAHRRRWESHEGGCGEMAHAVYAKKFRCLCLACCAERITHRRAARRRMRR